MIICVTLPISPCLTSAHPLPERLRRRRRNRDGGSCRLAITEFWIAVADDSRGAQDTEHSPATTYYEPSRPTGVETRLLAGAETNTIMRHAATSPTLWTRHKVSFRCEK